MVINGFQKMTLLDFPGHVACTVFTAGCNFRCPFCHNALLVNKISASDRIDEGEILSFLEKRKGLLDGVAITGGEPLMQHDIDIFIKKVKEMGYLVKLDTNGSFPERLQDILEEGIVDYVAMDIKNSKEKYAQTIASDPALLPRVENSVELLMNGKTDYEFRTTVCKELHTPDDIESIGKWIKGAKNYYIQPFKDSGDLVSDIPFSAPEDKQLLEMKEHAARYVPNITLRGIN